jgi:hypothetical protein
MADSAREQRIAARLRELARDRRALRLALEQFADAGAFARVWASDDPAEINSRDQVERPYERIVNDLQEIIDFCEAEEAERGTAPSTHEGDDEPGRWRRAALRGYLSHAQAERLRQIAWERQRFQHHYADLPARHGAEVYERAHELLDELPRAMRGLGRWITALWPPRPEG